MSKQIQNQGSARPNPTSGDVQGEAKPTRTPINYRQEVGGGKDELGDRGKRTNFPSANKGGDASAAN